ncbi:MAG TPA: PadR family transcriptional regulator [Candidatus Binatia bacterium]|nr:PadR family transcriptional regulator [Candidatus Binatia bacterium]
MLRFIVLGLLRDRAPRHGYALNKEYERRSGLESNGGRFYRELARLASDGLVEILPTPPGADSRQIRYAITPRGATAFDAWLASPGPSGDETSDDRLFTRALFLGRATPAVARALVDGWREEIRGRGARLEHVGAPAGEKPRASADFDPLPLLVARRLKVVAADLDLVERLWDAYERSMRPAAVPPPSRPLAPPAPAAAATRGRRS